MRSLASSEDVVATRSSAIDRPTGPTRISAALQLICQQDYSALKQLLDETRQQGSMLEFVQAFVTPLSIAVGEVWTRGELPIHAEHFYSALVERLLLRDIESMAATKRVAASVVPRILLVTLSGEQHTLGLTMTHAVLAEAGIPCVRLNSDLPVSEIVAACARHGFRAVGLSASVHYSRRLLRAQIDVLRKDLPADVELWLGGSGIDRASVLPSGSRTFNDFSSFIEAARRHIG
jgi:methanogenic corrinoid protein MtbC1